MSEQPSAWARWWPRLWPLGLFIVLVVCALSPALANGPLWSSRYDWRYFETMTEMARRTVADYHQAPLWNPYSCGGEVGLANPQAMDGAPTFLLVLLFGTAWGFKAAMAVYLLCALHGGFLLGRRLGLDPLPAAIAGASFGLSGYLAMHLSSGHINFAGAALYPYLLYCYDRAISRWHFALPAGALAAWIALLGGTFTPPMAGELLWLWATVDALMAEPRPGDPPAARLPVVLRRLGRNYALLLLCAAVALLLSAARMLPALEFIIDHPRAPFRRTPDVSTLPQLLTDLWFWRDFGPMPRRRYWSHEYTARLPALTAVLVLFTLPALLRGPQKVRRLWVLAVVSALLSMGNFAAWAPWSLLQKLPVLRDLRVPSRHLVLATLWLALLAGLGAQALGRWLARRQRARLGHGLLFALALLTGADAALFFAHSFKDVFTVHIVLPRERVRFYHLKGHWSLMRDLMLQGHGVMGCDEEAPLQRAEALDENDVPQERLLDPSAGTITDSVWTPNRREITVELVRSDTLLLINSNWNEHWHSLTPQAPLAKPAGRLAVDLQALGPGRHTIVLRYAPRSFFIGLVISALSLPLCVLLFWRRRRSCDPEPPATADSARAESPALRV